jgi:hypothetical protein
LLESPSTGHHRSQDRRPPASAHLAILGRQSRCALRTAQGGGSWFSLSVVREGRQLRVWGCSSVFQLLTIGPLWDLRACNWADTSLFCASVSSAKNGDNNSTFEVC